MDNEDYHRLNGKTARDERETELYKRMVKAAVRLHKIFPNVRGMTDAVCVLGESKHPNEEMKVDDLATWVTCSFDNGADSGTHTRALSDAVDLEKLEDKNMTLQTVNGCVRKAFKINKIKLAAQRKDPRENIIHALSSAEVERIGHQKGHMRAYINAVAQLMKMPPDLKKHFMDQCCDEQKEIQLILGQRGGGMLMHEIIPEQIGLVQQHWLLPNICIYKNPLTENLILAGELGIEGRLVDEDFPTLYPTRREIESLNIKLSNKKDLTADLGENLQARQLIPNELNN